jgi:phosphoglycolate phosphatase-like HAD superfamily hydrolase
MVLKNIDKEALYQSLQAIEGTQLNQTAHEEIAAFLRQSRLVSIPDIYQTSLCFDKAIQALDDLKQQDAPSAIYAGFEQDIRHYLEELLMINQLDAKQGDKLQAMAELNRNVRQLTGTIHYTTQKIRAYQHSHEEWPSNLGFLGKL